MNESNKEEPIEEEVSNENSKYAEVEDEVTYSSSSGDEDLGKQFPGKKIFAIGAYTKYSQAVRFSSRCIT